MNFNKIRGAVSLIWLLPVLALFGAGCTDQTAPMPKAAANIQAIATSPSFFETTALEKELGDYFREIDLKKYAEAYAHLSPSFQAQHPYTNWSEGYSNTLGHTLSSFDCRNNSCTADVIATENAAKGVKQTLYRFHYDFMKSSDGDPVIDTGTLVSSREVALYNGNLVSKTITDDQLKDLSYPVGSLSELVGSDSVQLSQGRKTLSSSAGNGEGFAELSEAIAHGDLNADGYEDAVVSLRVNTGGTGVWPLTFLVFNEHGNPRAELSDLPNLQDRDHIDRISIDDGKITFASTVHGPNDPACCATVKKTETFLFSGGSLTVIAAPRAQAPPQTTTAAPNGTYVNTYGNEVPSPYYAPSAPSGASAQCGDGTYSFSQSRRGTCSHHGGVAEWY